MPFLALSQPPRGAPSPHFPLNGSNCGQGYISAETKGTGFLKEHALGFPSERNETVKKARGQRPLRSLPVSPLAVPQARPGGWLPARSSHLPAGCSCLPASVSPNSVRQFLVETASHLARPDDPVTEPGHGSAVRGLAGSERPVDLPGGLTAVLGDSSSSGPDATLGPRKSSNMDNPSSPAGDLQKDFISKVTRLPTHPWLPHT